MSVGEQDHGPIACRTLPSSFQDRQCLVCRQKRYLAALIIFLYYISTARLVVLRFFPVAMEFTLLGD